MKTACIYRKKKNALSALSLKARGDGINTTKKDVKSHVRKSYKNQKKPFGHLNRFHLIFCFYMILTLGFGAWLRRLYAIATRSQ